MSVIFTEFTYFPRDVSETHTFLHSTEIQLILHYEGPFPLNVCGSGNSNGFLTHFRWSWSITTEVNGDQSFSLNAPAPAKAFDPANAPTNAQWKQNFRQYNNSLTMCQALATQAPKCDTSFLDVIHWF